MDYLPWVNRRILSIHSPSRDDASLSILISVQRNQDSLGRVRKLNTQGAPTYLPDARQNPEHRRSYHQARKEEGTKGRATYCRSHTEEQRRWKKTYYQTHKDDIRESKKTHYLIHKKEVRERQKAYYASLRVEAFNHYGWVCVKCGEANTDFLTLDHVNDGGAQHRRRFGPVLYLWAKENGYPPALQAMCYNCQWVKELRRRRDSAWGSRASPVDTEYFKERRAKGFCCSCKIDSLKRRRDQAF